jgi:hypothetical protein
LKQINTIGNSYVNFYAALYLLHRIWTYSNNGLRVDL